MEPQLNSAKRSRNDILPRQYYASTISSITFPPNVTTIPRSCFESCKN